MIALYIFGYIVMACITCALVTFYQSSKEYYVDGIPELCGFLWPITFGLTLVCIPLAIVLNALEWVNILTKKTLAERELKRKRVLAQKVTSIFKTIDFDAEREQLNKDLQDMKTTREA